MPVGLTATDVTSPRCPCSVLTHSPEVTSQNLIVLSLDLRDATGCDATGGGQVPHRPQLDPHAALGTYPEMIRLP